MTTRNVVLSNLMSDYQQRRDRNAQLEAERLKEVTDRCPEIGEMIKRRQDIIFSGIRMALDGKELKDAPSEMDMCSKRIRELLKKNGYEESYLQPLYDCKICQDMGYVGDNVRDMCVCLKTAYHQQLFKAVGLNEQTPQTFETFDENVYSRAILPSLDTSQRDVALMHLNTAKRYAESFPNTETRDLLLQGKSGSGKTFLLHAIAHHVLERGFLVLCVSAYKVVELSRKAHFQNDLTEMQPLFDAELLLVDDLGTEPMMENITIPYLYNIINERQQGGKHTVITTNLSKDDLKARYTERITSRLLDRRQCRVMAFVGDDVRKRGLE